MSVDLASRSTRGSLIFYEQTDIQTIATTGANGMKAHVESCDIAPDQPLEESKVINDTRNPTDPYEGGIVMKGGYSVQSDAIGIGYYLKWLFGAPVTTGPVSTIYTHVFKVNASSVLTALTVERFLADVAQCYRAKGVKLDSFSFDISRGACLSSTFSIVGLNEVRDTSRIDSAPWEPSKTNKFLAGQIAMLENGGAFNLVKKFNQAFNNNYEGLDVLGNNGEFYDFIEGVGTPTGGFTMYVKDGTIYDKARGIVESKIKLTLTAKDGVSSLELFWPEVKYMAHGVPLSGGKGATPVDVVFKAFADNDASGTSLQITLKNLHPDYSTIPA
jgi:hypothetical protein